MSHVLNKISPCSCLCGLFSFFVKLAYSPFKQVDEVCVQGVHRGREDEQRDLDGQPPGLHFHRLRYV